LNQDRRSRRAGRLSGIVELLIGRIAKKLNISEEEAARLAKERGILR